MSSTATRMQVVSAIADIRSVVTEARRGGGRIGFVPTMGALHEGHRSLVERARLESDFTVMSIFVNPLQFAPTEDFARYPRPVEDDDRLARDAGVDILFRPAVDDMYPEDKSIAVTAGRLGSEWEGASRPGHFDGVLTVVTKLFNIVRPDVAVFGRKDLQQAALVQALVRDLDIPVTIALAPIVRESDGIAMSSRNRYLDVEDRRRARVLGSALAAISEAYRLGERSVHALESVGLDVMRTEPGVQVDYLAVIDPRTFKRSTPTTSPTAAIVAARVGRTRLIDNMTLGPDDQD